MKGAVGGHQSTSVNDIQLNTLISDFCKNRNNLNDNNEFFGSWNGFTTLNGVSESSIEETSYEHTSGMKSVASEDMEYGDARICFQRQAARKILKRQMKFS